MANVKVVEYAENLTVVREGDLVVIRAESASQGELEACVELADLKRGISRVIHELSRVEGHISIKIFRLGRSITHIRFLTGNHPLVVVDSDSLDDAVNSL